MLIKLYTTKSSNNTINKVLENEQLINVKFKGNADILNPIIELKRDSYILSNYCYIPDFNRFYFIDNIEIYPNNIYTLSLKVDVLESFKNEILMCNADIIKQENINQYYDSDYKSEVRKEIDIYKSNVTLDNGKSTILTTIGGV